MVELEAGEQVLHEIRKVGYETPERVKKALLGPSYIEKGTLKLTNSSLIFEGKKIQRRFKKISKISKKDTKVKLGGGYVQVDYKGSDGKEKSALFGASSMAFWSKGKATENLYNTLTHWLQSEKKEAQYMPRCPTCRQVATFVQQYNKWYCTRCQRYL